MMMAWSSLIAVKGRHLTDFDFFGFNQNGYFISAPLSFSKVILIMNTRFRSISRLNYPPKKSDKIVSGSASYTKKYLTNVIQVFLNNPNGGKKQDAIQREEQ